MDKLKNFIDTHKEAFEDDLPPMGHFGRFDKKLSVSSRKRLKWIQIFTVAVAAAVTLFVFIRIQSDMNVPIQQAKTYTCETQKEIDELKFYYNMQLDEVSAQIRALYKSEQIPGGLELLEETKKILKNSHEFEDAVLPTLPCSDAGLFAMNQHYSNSLECLQIMLSQMGKAIQYNNN
ncbi:MAG: hypothetical protein LBL58_15120 [Tannerellaceae bacterium]|jgi:hypothetical protein|nr:hypothetical protein [Tannerellaceae bacterium]